MSDHARHDALSLTYHQAIAAKLVERPELIERARANLARWREGRTEELWMREWMLILQRPLEEVVQLLNDPGDRATRLRQSSPFTGILTSDERRAIYARFTRKP